MKTHTIAAALAVSLSACTTAPKHIVPTSVSPLQYAQFDCAQLAAESARVRVRAAEVGGLLDQAASSDQAIAAVGMVLFWPALFFLGGNKQQEAEFARLKGEYAAIQQAAITMKCPGAVAPATTTESKR